MSPRRTLLFLLFALVGHFTPLAAQDQSDIIRGRVIGPDKKPLEGVTVTATSLVDQTSRNVKTNKDGRFTIIFNGGGGDYMMAYTMIGFQPSRFEVKREVDEDILAADAVMSKQAIALEAMRVTGDRERPDRNGNAADIGGREQTVNSNNVPINLLGDLSAMAASLPGVTMIAGADGAANQFTVLGLSPDQNNITLNGLNFSGTDLPRDATTTTRVSTSTFDPSRGGFSGAQIAIRTVQGNNYVQRAIHTTVDAPDLQYVGPLGNQLGQTFTNLQASGNLSGPITYDKAFYAFSWQLGQRSSDLQSLINTDPAALAQVGVSADSITKLLQALNTFGIPMTSSAIPSDKLTRNGSFISSFDFSPSGTHNYDLTLNGRWNDAAASSISTTAVPDHGGDNQRYGGTVQLRHSAYFLDNFLDETAASAQESITHGTPYLVLPSASVRVASTFPDSVLPAVSNLSIGGNSGLPSDNNTLNTELQNTLSWISLDNKHHYKLMLDGHFDRYSQSNDQNSLGTFTYNSLQAFENDSAASFTRRLQTNRRLSSDEQFSASLGDAYRVTTNFQLTYGVRMDMSHFDGNPAFNGVVDSIFHQDNSTVPRGIYFSPRLGFSWRYGTNPQIEGFQGAFRGTRGQISGGVGMFQNLPQSTIIAGAVDNTGLPSAAQQLTCVGPAVPAQDWAAWLQNTGTIPTTCAGGASVFSSTVPNVQLFAPDYIPSHSWRANLTWNTPILGNRFNASMTGAYSLNLNQQGILDLNFNDSTSSNFHLANEGNRPVYTLPSSVVPTTGQIALGQARFTQDFAQVTQYRSDLTSHTTQASFGISPVAFNSSFLWNVTYVWQRIMDEERGFDANTAGDPEQLEWARGPRDARHQITFNAAYTIHSAITISAFGRVQSGNPFTPMVSGDINGDGYANDRAFLFGPTAPAGADSAQLAVANGIKSLLATAPSSVRSCINSQIGTVAGRNSCEGPWSTTLNLRISLVSQALKIPDRATISLGINNPLTGIDALVHGPNNLHGWGAPSLADPTLLEVTGFNQNTQEFTYSVNPRFGQNRNATTAALAPLQFTLDVRFDVGPERERQDLMLALRPGRGGKGNKANEQALKLRYMRNYPNPFEQILRQQDSLKLADSVADSIAILNKTYGRIIDSIWTPVAHYLANLPDKYDENEAYEQVRTAENKSLDQMAIYGPAAKKLLTDEQIRKLPAFIALFLDDQAIRNVRPGRAGGGRGGLFGT